MLFTTVAQAVKHTKQQLINAGIKGKLQYHKHNDTISAMGYNLSSSRHAVGNIDRYDYGRWMVAKIESVALGYGYVAYDVHGIEL